MMAAGEDAGRTSAPLCFMHVPKCGGQSVARALDAVVPSGSIAPRGADLESCRTVSNLDSLEHVADWIRALVASGDEEIEVLRAYRFVAGHFMLSTLLRLTPPERIATVLREPRARLLSFYVYFRTPEMRRAWGDSCGDLLDSAAGPLDEFLHEPAIARATDNQVCRMVLGDDPRIPDDGFIADRDVEPVAAATLEQLDRLGFVGILESGAPMWRALSQTFGVELTPMWVNESATPAASAGAAPIPSYDEDAAFDGLERRGAADRIVYETVVARRRGGSRAARQQADDAFSEQLARFQRVRAAAAIAPAGEDAGRTSAPLCFMHVPKCGGQSAERALEVSFPTGIAPYGVDLGGCRAVSSREDFEDVEDWIRELIALRHEEIEALRDYRFVAGHFMLATLLRIAPPERIATVLREPRARLLSLYLFFRTPRMRETWEDYCGEMLDGAAGPLDEFLHEPALARATDNQVCRMVLGDDPRIPDDGFIADRDVEPVAAATLEQLDRLGFVGILESGALMWRGLSRTFGAALAPARVNESGTPEASAGADPIPAYDSAAALDGLERRAAADRLVYEAFVARLLGSAHGAHRQADDAFARQLARFDRVRAAVKAQAAPVLAAAHDPGAP